MEFSYSSRYNGDFDVMNNILNMSDGVTLKPTNFVGKMTTSVVECPHIFWTKLNQTTLALPSTMADTISQVAIDLVKTLNGSVDTRATTTNLGYGQHLFSFNVIEYLDRILGTVLFKGLTTTAEKVVKAKQIINSFTFNWYGVGSSVSGNKASLKLWANGGSVWDPTNITHTNSVITKLSSTKFNTGGSPSGGNDVGWFMDNNGFVHAVAFADPSNGTVSSSISTDYAELIINVKI